jgi:hypothetical protein
VTTFAQLRKAALSLPEAVEQGARPGPVVFTVHDKRFTSLDEDGLVHLHLPAVEVDEVLAAHPSAERLVRGSAVVGVRVPIGDVNGQQLNHWVRRAWLGRAPKRLAGRVAAGPGEVGDLPAAIGKPATRALGGAGVTTLAQVAELTDAELLAMHGVGPKAVRLLREVIGG